MGIRTKKTVQNIKTISRNIKSGYNRIKTTENEAKRTDFNNDVEYADYKMKTFETEIGNSSIYHVSKIGTWGVKETAKNIRYNRFKKQKSKKIKYEAKTKFNKTSKKMAEKIKQTTKEIFAFIRKSVKSIGNAVKGIIAAIAAGGWVAVVIILLLSVIGLIVGSVFGVFITDKPQKEDYSILKTLKECENVLNDDIEKIKNSYSYDDCIQTGNTASPEFIVALYVVIANEHDEVITFNEDKSNLLKKIYKDIHYINHKKEIRTVTEVKQFENEDGIMENVLIERDKIFLLIHIKSLPQDEVFKLYGLSPMQIEKMNFLLSDENHDLWRNIFQ